jgi:hypothetical protein
MNTLENGTYPPITDKQAKHLYNQGLIYGCGFNHYKFADGVVYADIELSLKGIPNE